MKPLIALTACALTWSTTTLAATRPYDTRAFEAVSVAAGITVEVTLGSPRSVVAETRGKGFDDLHISVEDDVLRIARPARSWFSLGRRADYRVRVVTPVLHSVSASSGSEVTVDGNLQGDLAVEASSGSEVDITKIKGGVLTARSSSGSKIHLAGSCVSLEARASSGSDLDAEDLQCENVAVQASSGSDLSVGATKRITGQVSSGADVKVRGRPDVVQVEKSSGGDVVVRN